MPLGIFIALFGYLLGSIPTGLLLSKLFSKVDPRLAGSKNIGATNVFRTVGKTLGILTLIGDVLKGLIPVCVAIQWGVTEQWGVTADQWIALAGLSPFLGHVFPIFLGFKGGKGVATAVGIYLPISPVAVLIEVFIFAGIVWKWRYISLGSITCAITIPILLAYLRSDSQAYFIVSIIMAALILYRHQSNIAKLLQGTENRWKG
ncbi:MAG: glycerol-3-phosphate 1-O-acyltransferase PlsY [Deltaproteobacteria bacterium]|nr:glycerol-3-phosphate 1-O-acyltransferase PlsY [Deltaproteobacteria bacterium]MBM4323078.1 glycerol-3-phosphate 1-O-acyltransferase PlsY [Deltaproteobacteria bacterium]MBM4346673.1 glycerol-3-phosphate 1-O-acyltransferase PlsY [Deltaproteobacteria bacterium]